MTSTIAARTLHVIAFFASLLICSFPCSLSADTPQIRVSVDAQGLGGDTPAVVSALSREFRKLDGVLVTDKRPELEISCNVMRETANSGRFGIGYAASVAITDSNGRLLGHNVLTHNTIDELAHAIAINVDGAWIEEKRRAAQPSTTP
jgi:hypothetical protein